MYVFTYTFMDMAWSERFIIFIIIAPRLSLSLNDATRQYLPVFVIRLSTSVPYTRVRQ